METPEPHASRSCRAEAIPELLRLSFPLSQRVMTPSLDSRPTVLPVCADSWELVAETPDKSRSGESSQSGYVSASNSRAKARAQVAGSVLLPGLEEPEMP